MLLPLLQNNLLTTSGAYTLNAESGGYSLTGSESFLIRSLILDSSSGAYSLTGSDASLLRALILSQEPGEYLITGSNAEFSVLGTAEVTDQPSNWNVKRKRRPYSLEDWESWVNPEEKIIEDGVLPVELKQQAELAVAKIVNSTPVKDEGKLVLNAMEALRSYEEAYKKAYKEAYNQEVVYQLHRSEVLRAKRNRAVALLLLH